MVKSTNMVAVAMVRGHQQHLRTQLTPSRPLIMCRATVIDSLFTPAYDGDGSTLSTYNLSALYSILALGTLFDTSLDPNCQEFKTRRYWSRKLFYLQWPHSPSTIEKLEALVLLFRVSWPFFDEAYAENYEMIAWGIKICEKVRSDRSCKNSWLKPLV